MTRRAGSLVLSVPHATIVNSLARQYKPRPVEEVSRMSEMDRMCPDCGDVRMFSRLHERAGGCPDSPDGECPEWWCEECGAALLLGMERQEPAAARAPGKVA